MIAIRKYCRCGSKLEATARNEDEARNIVMGFYREHTGAAHGLVKRWQFNCIVQAMVARLGQQQAKPQSQAVRRYTIKRAAPTEPTSNQLIRTDDEPEQTKTLGGCSGEFREID